MGNSLIRCFANQPDQTLYAAYHDNEWGVPVHDDVRLFEMLVLEGAQAGLNWETVLKKRNYYRLAFYGFDPKRAALMTDSELETLLHNPGLIRNRRKIFSVRQNAQVFLKIQNEFGSFDKYLWSFVKGEPIINQWEHRDQVPATSPAGNALSKDLKTRGMSFVGPKIIYAYMQATGLVDDHLMSCWQRTKPT